MNLKHLIVAITLLVFTSCNGKVKKYYKNGNLKSIEMATKGKKNGAAIYYDSLGNIELKGDFKDDLENGLFEEYKDGNLSARINYKMGKVEGDCYDYKGGKIEVYSIYKDDSLVYMKRYDSVGNIKSEVYYEHQIENGPFKAYKSGKLWFTAKCVNGEMVGDKTYYDENGKVIKVVPVK